MTRTSRVALSLVLKVPGRCTVALRRQVTEPEVHCSVGEVFAGIAYDIG
jgi:hypothetical protein